MGTFEIGSGNGFPWQTNGLQWLRFKSPITTSQWHTHRISSGFNGDLKQMSRYGVCRHHVKVHRIEGLRPNSRKAKRFVSLDPLLALFIIFRMSCNMVHFDYKYNTFFLMALLGFVSSLWATGRPSSVMLTDARWIPGCQGGLSIGHAKKNAIGVRSDE